MSKQKELEKLFEEWKIAHNQGDDSNTFPLKDGMELKDSFKTNFIWDGFLNDRENGTILFVLKESNVSKDHPDLVVGDDRTFFAYKNRKQNNGYSKRLQMLAEKIKEQENLDVAGEWWEYCAYMNINKRGGYGRCDSDRLKAYIEEYKSFIKKEIEIIAPRVLVFLGSDFKDAKEMLLQQEKSTVVYSSYHPGIPFCNKERYLKSLKK